MRRAKAAKTFEIWCEGYAGISASGKAHFMGTGHGNTLEEACKWRFGSSSYFKEGTPPTYWGCRLFDNEADARKSFG